MNKKEHILSLSLIVITWAIFFIPIISGAYTYYLDDLKIIYYPIETLYAKAQHSWQLPLWSNELGFGQPLLAWGQLGFFTPIHILLRALFVPPLALLQVSVVSYFLIGSIGMYFFLVRRNLHIAAATLGALVFAYCGFNVGHLNHVNFYTSTMLLPWLLLAVDSLIQSSTIKRATTLALIASAITVSGQPQVIFYTFSIAAIISLGIFVKRLKIRSLLGIGYAIIVAFLLSSFALLPLQEFLPSTERAGGLPMTELFEFSYPPFETITLILPYFFGDHANYFGPKGFQELAAYVGIIPIILTGIALFSWKSHKGERIAGIILVFVGAILALGKYSPVYTYLVDHHFITSIGVVGRFVFFFDVGIVLLAAIGLHDILLTQKNTAKNYLRLIPGYLFPILLIVIPFGLYASQNPEAQQRLSLLFNTQTLSWWVIVIGAISPAAILLGQLYAPQYKKIIPWILPTLTAGTLLVYGWGYNPVVPSERAFTSSPFAEELAQYRETTGLPARIYAADRLPVTGNPRVEVSLSDRISPLFTVLQPLTIARDNVNCLIIPIQSDAPEESVMSVTISEGLAGKIWHKQEISSGDAFTTTKNQRICFPEIPKEIRENLLLSFSSDEQTNMQVFVTPSKGDNANLSFVRVKSPNADQLERSKKPLSVQYTAQSPKVSDSETALMMRHIQAVAGASSARWIGALSIRPYREFIDSFFANDSDPFDGDGIHALTRNKKLVDMVGITHFAQALEYGQTNDAMITAGYNLIKEANTGDSIIRLYENKAAYPKAFIVPKWEFVPADDEIRFKLRDPLFNPKELAYVTGPVPPPLAPNTNNETLSSSANITRYTNTQVDIEVTTNKEALLILNDSTTPEWHTFIDGKPTLQLRANSLFKAALVPPGTHIVSFQYKSPAIELSKNLTILGIVITLVGYAFEPIQKRIRKS